MPSKLFKIFGFNIRFELDNSNESTLLLDELSCYPEIDSINHDFIIQYKAQENIADDVLLNNPSSHYLHKDGFSMKTNYITARFIFEDDKLIKIIFSYNRKKSNFLFSALQKWLHIQFLNEKETIGQIVHELLLVPANFFLSNRSLIHSSAVVTKKGRLLMFGGTGGVGKTSLELELCSNHACSFFADDICIVDNMGNAYPNLSFPKIYGYNLINNSQLKSVLISSKNIPDNLHWKLHSLRGLDKVRRRISPAAIYEDVTNTTHPIDSFFILNRMNVDEMEINEVDNNYASILNTEVIKSEYQMVFQHLFWYKYNSLIRHQEDSISFEQTMEKNTQVFCDSLNEAGAKSYIIDIPIHLTNAELKEQITVLLEKLELL